MEEVREHAQGRIDHIKRTPLQDNGHVIVISDITEWKRAEAMLRESEQRLTALLEASPGGVSINALDGTRLWANAELARMYGQEVDEIIGTTSQDNYLSPAARHDVIERFERDGGLRNHEVEQRRANGSRIWVLLTLASIAYEGQPARIVWTFDVTERKRKLDAVAETEAQLRIALSHMPGGIRFIDEDGCYLLFNDRYPELYELPPDLLRIGTHISVENRFQAERGDFGPGDTEDLAWKRLSALAANQESRSWEHRTVDGRVLQVNTSPTPDGGSVDVVVDISALKHAEQDALAAREEAERANQTKSTFLASMSHEIRTPMNVVLGMIELLEKADLPGDQTDLTNTMKEAANALLSLIDDVLDFSKIEAGELTIHVAPLSLERLINTVASIIGANAAKKGIELAVALDGDLPAAVLADLPRLRQILLNLLSNAVKFTDGGSVILRVSDEGAVGATTRVRFEVIDTGIGIPEDDLSDLFDPFKQASTNAIGEYGGTGLGLSICERLVTKMGGEIGVLSELGMGSTFWFTVPLEATDLVEPDEADLPNVADLLNGQQKQPSVQQALAAGQLILVAEDQPNNRDLLRRQLDTLGFASEFAEDGEQARNMFLDKDYGLVLTDCHMPKLDGFGLVAAIRGMEQEGRPRTPVVALTANALAGEEERCLAAGMDAFISKPAGLRTLGATLVKWIGVPRAVGDEAPPGSITPTDLNSGLEDRSPFDLDLLEDMLGVRDLDQLAQMVTRFKPYLTELLDTMEAAFASGDLQTLKAAAHKAASGAGSTSAKGLMKALVDIEDAISKKSGADLLGEKVSTARHEGDRVLAWNFQDDGSIVP